MKKNKLVASLCLVITVLFSLLFQSLHTYEHLSKQLSEKHCDHKYNVSGTEITHQHHNIEHCSVCHFALSSCIPAAPFSYQFYTALAKIPYFGSVTQTVVWFLGHTYFLRGPPVNSYL